MNQLILCVFVSRVVLPVIVRKLATGASAIVSAFVPLLVQADLQLLDSLWLLVCCLPAQLAACRCPQTDSAPRSLCLFPDAPPPKSNHLLRRQRRSWDPASESDSDDPDAQPAARHCAHCSFPLRGDARSDVCAPMSRSRQNDDNYVESASALEDGRRYCCQRCMHSSLQSD